MRTAPKLLTMAAAALAAVHTAPALAASVVTFDDAVGNSILDLSQSSFSDQGLTFTSSGSAMYVWDSGSPNSNGTNNNIFGFGPTDFETITKTGGGTFNLLSMDMAISWYDTNPSEVVTINGAPITLTQTLTDYTLNLTGVTQVSISGVASGDGYWLADNVTFSGGVPESSTWAMMLLGFGGLGLTAYRRANPRGTAPLAAT